MVSSATFSPSSRRLNDVAPAGAGAGAAAAGALRRAFALCGRGGSVSCELRRAS